MARAVAPKAFIVGGVSAMYVRASFEKVSGRLRKKQRVILLACPVAIDSTTYNILFANLVKTE
jgi:hypothetical protein